jgi:threonine dehydrogenase-like Zn-dependent dehydrogenase
MRGEGSGVDGRAVRFTAPREARVEPVAVPEPGPADLLVETRASAVSPGTELLVYRDQVPSGMELDESIAALSGAVEYPLTYGYAAVGEVVDAGSRADPSWIGRTVFAFHPHESHFLARPRELYPVPEGIDATAATMLPTFETAVTIALDAAPRLGERAAVFGQGPVGLATTAQFAAFPLAELTVVDPVAGRRAAGESFGADRALAPAAVREAFDPEPPGDDGVATGSGVDLAVELSGDPDALDDAIAVTGYDGRVIVGSWYGTKRADLSLGGRFHRSRVSVESSQVSTIDPDLRGRWDAIRRLGVAWNRLAAADLDRLVTDCVDVDEAPETYRRLDEGAGDPLAVVFTYD